MQTEMLACLGCGNDFECVITDRICKTGRAYCPSCSEIVKVQISIVSSEPAKQVLVYNQSRSHHYQGDATPEIIKAMNGEPKKFFHALLPKKAGVIELLDEAEWQEW